MDGVVFHRQGNGSVRLVLDASLGVCGVVLGLQNKLLATRSASGREKKNTVKHGKEPFHFWVRAQALSQPAQRRPG